MLIQLLLVIPISFVCIWLNSYLHRIMLRRKFKRGIKTFVQLQDEYFEDLIKSDDAIWAHDCLLSAYEVEELRKQQRHNN